jgi:hypothetical protein
MKFFELHFRALGSIPPQPDQLDGYREIERMSSRRLRPPQVRLRPETFGIWLGGRSG